MKPMRSSGRTLLVLEAFARHGRAMSLGQAAKTTGLDKSAVQRSADTLACFGYLERDETGQHRISPHCLDLAFNFLKSHPIVQKAYPVLLKLHQETGERTNLSLFERTNLIYAIRIVGNDDCDLHSALVGRRMPVFSTAGGRAMLAKLPEDEVRKVLKDSNLRRRTAQTKTSTDEILREVRCARELGYAVVTGESVASEIALAAAVTDGEGLPLAAIHVASNRPHWSAEGYSRRLGVTVVEAARKVSDSLLEG